MISQPATGSEEHGRQAGASRRDHRLIRLAELVAQAVDVGVIDAGETPELLERDEGHAERRRAAQHPPPVAMAVDHQLRVRAQNLHRGQPDGVHAHHQAGPTVGDDMVVAAQHLVEVARQVGRIHHSLACSVA